MTPAVIEHNCHGSAAGKRSHVIVSPAVSSVLCAVSIQDSILRTGASAKANGSPPPGAPIAMVKESYSIQPDTTTTSTSTIFPLLERSVYCSPYSTKYPHDQTHGCSWVPLLFTAAFDLDTSARPPIASAPLRFQTLPLPLLLCISIYYRQRSAIAFHSRIPETCLSSLISNDRRLGPGPEPRHLLELEPSALREI
jgi:hypothetical protein